MTGILNRGNLILGLSWVMAIAMFVNRAGKLDAHAGGAKAPRARSAQVIVSTPAVEVPVAAELGEALSRNDSARPLP
jgi:hypothetical protein